VTHLLAAYVRAVNSANDFRDREEGATAVEYGMMVALIAAVIVTVVAILGEQVRDAFQTI
jgi:pilus assembly protein Flp/PilA